MVSKKQITSSLKRSTPLISVIMPAYNAEKYIAQAIKSILEQTFPYFEFIIIDDCSSDKTYDVIKKYEKLDSRIIVIKNLTNEKLSKTLNKGIKIAKGKYIARMDADDWSYKDRLEKQYSFMEKNIEVGIVGGTMQIVDKKNHRIGVRRYTMNDEQIRKKIFWYSPFSHPLIMIRASVLNKAGYYNHLFNPAEDYELYFRIGKYAKFANLPDLLLKYRIIDKSMTTGLTKDMELQTIKIRNKYGKQREYHQTFLEKIYNLIHLLSVYIVPPKLKMALFNSVRNG